MMEEFIYRTIALFRELPAVDLDEWKQPEPEQEDTPKGYYIPHRN
jgi:hypothetical protein